MVFVFTRVCVFNINNFNRQLTLSCHTYTRLMNYKDTPSPSSIMIIFFFIFYSRSSFPRIYPFVVYTRQCARVYVFPPLRHDRSILQQQQQQTIIITLCRIGVCYFFLFFTSLISPSYLLSMKKKWCILLYRVVCVVERIRHILLSDTTDTNTFTCKY